MKLRIQLTPAHGVEIRGTGAVAEAAEKELAEALRDTASSPPLFSFIITDAPPPPGSGSYFGMVRTTKSGIAWRMDRMDYDLVFAPNEPLTVTMHTGRRGPPFRIPRGLFPLIERTAISWPQAQAYHAMLLLEFFALLTGQVGVLHASAVERDKRVLAITSTGGVGKTTSAFRLVKQAGFRHLADDVLLVDQSGQCSRSVRKLMVYPYNTRDLPMLEHAVRKGGSLQYLLWKLDDHLGLDRRRRRVKASDIFERDVASNGRLDAVVLMRRSHRPGVCIHDVTRDSIAARATEIIISEFAPFFDMLRTSAALVGDDFPWSSDRVARRNYDALRNAFAATRRLHVADVGPSTDPTETLADLAMQ